MASSVSESDSIKTSTPSLKRSRIRVVGKIRGFKDQEQGLLKNSSNPWISVQKPNGESSDHVTLSLTVQSNSRKECYEIDYCYEQGEGNDLIFMREVKPLICEVFGGRNASLLTFGARGSGKTFAIQGFNGSPGLAELAISEIISLAEEGGRAVSISCYAIHHDHAYDLLDPKHPDISVLEDGRGNVKLKGLSQVPVKSVLEFCRLYLNEHSVRKPSQKNAIELPRRSHRGLTIYVSSPDGGSQFVGKMNFVDLAGYEDIRRKISDGPNITESAKINKSLYAIQNVIHALNANEGHVPYRESKVTRMLQDSMRRTNRILTLVCLNPYFCQDTMYVVNLACRSRQGINRGFTNSGKQTKSLMMQSSKTSGAIGTHSTTMKKKLNSLIRVPERKPTSTTLKMRGRLLFDEVNHLSSSKQVTSLSDVSSSIQAQEEEKVVEDNSLPDTSSAIDAQEEDSRISDVSSLATPLEEKSDTIAQKSDTIALEDAKPTSLVEKDTFQYIEESHSEVTSRINSSTKGQEIVKENHYSLLSEGESLSVSAKIQEVSNALKALYYSTPTCVKVAQEKDNSSLSEVCTKHNSSLSEVPTDILEPKTPVAEQKTIFKENTEVTNICSPWETYSVRNAGMKKSLVQEYLKFLNSASKEELKRLKGIGEKRAMHILQRREESPEPFKDLDDLKGVGLSAKQIKGLIKSAAGELFS
ncbi:hypothetical protein RJ641_033857 [Dillenia turbinata]|uniref:Kinesin motor domain-containing protein n=1 Tax=Dillenia turbinata TaxID=194707 RepID=A0AAN8ZGG2_9MAGN